MSEVTHIQEIEGLLTPLLQDDIFLVSIRIKAINNIKIFLDADGGLGIEKCIKINRALYRIMEEKGMYPEGDFSLEVSSPGTEEPLKLHRQYVKNVGRSVEVTLTDDTKKEGKLTAVTDTALFLEQTSGKGKKLVTINEEIGFDQVKQTKVQVKF